MVSIARIDLPLASSLELLTLTPLVEMSKYKQDVRKVALYFAFYFGIGFGYPLANGGESILATACRRWRERTA